MKKLTNLLKYFLLYTLLLTQQSISTILLEIYMLSTTETIQIRQVVPGEDIEIDVKIKQRVI